MPPDVVGRQAELAEVRRFLADAGEGPTLLVLEGEAGIGKTALWQVSVEEARRLGHRVLVSRPAEAERSLAHVGLGDLLDPVRELVLPALATPRRRALEVALLLDAPADAADPRALGIAVADALRLLAQDAPVVVAVDDVQWFDASSTHALAFAARRLAGSRVLLLLARRRSGPAPPSGLEEAVGKEQARRLALQPLGVGALHRLLRERLGRPFARQTLLRIHERSGGNPYFALELARVLAADGDSLQPLDVPETLDELLRTRLDGIPAAARDALALAAATGTVDEALLARAGFAPDVLAPAFAAGVVERDGGAIRFAHPLLSSVLYRDLGEERLQLHARLAGLVEDPLLHARHLALATRAPDAGAAAVLDDAAALAARRGAPAVAAELAEHALRLTPAGSGTEGHRRALAACRAQHAAGEWTRARAVATGLLAETGPGSFRAEVLVALAELESVEGAVVLLQEALHEAATRPELQALIECRLAWATRFRDGYVRALEHARSALRLADRLDDGGLRRRARTVTGILGWFAGEADAPKLGAADLDLADALGGERLVQEAILVLVDTHVRRDEVRATLEREHREWRERDDPRAARALWGLSWVELWAGRWELALAYADEAYDVATQYGIEVPQDHLPIALIALRQGRIEAARTHSESALELAQAQFGLHPPQHAAILALVAAETGDLAGAVELLEGAERQAHRLGWAEPTIRWWSDDLAEVLLELGRVDDAVRIVDTWEADATRLHRPRVLAHVTRCRGLVAAARDDVDGAILLLERAVARHEQVGDPFGRARALLALGVARRRARQKRSSREAIEEAVDGFEALGAAVWAERARGELGRLGGRTRTEGLTAAERRVADLVAQGQTNREIAAALFLAERTVASHLTHVYAKLGVRSRTELAHRLHVASDGAHARA